MKSSSLAFDYIERARKRLQAIETLFSLEDWPDTVRESQEAVELALKALLRFCRIEPPRVHDVSDVLLEHAASLSPAFQEQLPQIAQISRRLRRDRELAFYGSEDLTPSQFYRRHDAEEALSGARTVIEAVSHEIERTDPGG